MLSAVKFLVDENLPVEAAEMLRNAGHEAVTVAELRLRGSTDTKLAELVKAERRALLTQDVDFANTQVYPPADYFGLVVLRLSAYSRRHILAVLQQVVPQLTEETLVRKLWIVEEDRIRIRG